MKIESEAFVPSPHMIQLAQSTSLMQKVELASSLPFMVPGHIHKIVSLDPKKDIQEI